MAELLVGAGAGFRLRLHGRRAPLEAPPERPDATPRRVQKVGIVGAGLMATQLARSSSGGSRCRSSYATSAEQSTTRSGTWGRHEVREEVGAKKAFLATLVNGGTGWDQFAGCDLVLEAVFEELDVKRRCSRRCARSRRTRSSRRTRRRSPSDRRWEHGRRAALLQPGRVDAARRDRPHAADDRRKSSQPRGTSSRS